MIGLRSAISRTVRGSVLCYVRTPGRITKIGSHCCPPKGPPQPFDNMPFRILNRYVATVFFSVFFGVGLWAPFLIVWYSMAKKTL